MSRSRSHGSSSHNSHGRLHRRGNSASSVTGPLSPGAFTFSRSETPVVTYEEPWGDFAPPMAAATSHAKIKPFLRKLSSPKDNDLDLSRPAAENERLAGLGITEYGGYTPSAGEVSFASVKPRSHARSTSNTSQFSSSSSLQRPLPPIRQTPRPYTPPTSKSTPASGLLNGDSETADDNIMTDDEFRMRQAAFEPTRRSGSLSSSTPGTVPALRLHTSASSSLLAGSYSQSAVSLASPPAHSRPRGDTMISMDTTSPSSRTSFDKAFGFRRSRDTPADAAARAASIRAAREAFREKEEAKERKYYREVHKQAERETRKQYKKDERERRKSESHDKRSRSVSDPNMEKSSRPSVGGRQYSDHRQAHTSTLPNHVTTVDQEKSGAVVPKVTKSRQAKGRWLRFVTWFKTRLLRISSRLHVGS